MTYRQCLNSGIHILQENRISDAEFDACELFKKAFGVDNTWLFMHGEEEMNDTLESACCVRNYHEFLDKRISGIPLQYILGEWDFYNLTFQVGEGVLIPRPETELLVDLALAYLKKLTPENTPLVLDLCAGTGCIGITIGKNFKNCRVIEVEKSEIALKYTEKNIQFTGADNVRAVQFDIFDGFEALAAQIGIPHENQPVLLVSNPPYVRTSALNGLQKEVLFEPSMALDGGSDGLSFYRVICDKWIPYLKPEGLFIVECGEDQSEELEKIFSASCACVFKEKDFSGIYRVIGGKK